MRMFSFVVFLLVIWLATCSAPQAAGMTPAATQPAVPEGKLPAAPFDSQVYVNEAAGFALDIPSGWTVSEAVIGSRGAQVQFLSTPGLADSPAVPAGETRLSATVYQWDPRGDLPAYVENRRNAWSASGFAVLDERSLTLEQGLPAVELTVETPESQVVYLIAALGDSYLELAGEGDLDLVRQIVERLRPVSP